MTMLRIGDATLVVSFTRPEKVFGLLRDQHIPLTAVHGVEVVPDGLTAAKGLRAPGLGLPGRRKLGTWRSRTGTTLVAVRGHGPAVRVTLAGHRYAALLVTTEDPEGFREELTARL